MAAGATSQPSSVESERGREGDPEQSKGEGQNTAQEGWAELGTEPKKGLRRPGQCLPKASITPNITIKSEGLDAHIQYMKDRALIEKFVGI